MSGRVAASENSLLQRKKGRGCWTGQPGGREAGEEQEPPALCLRTAGREGGRRAAPGARAQAPLLLQRPFPPETRPVRRAAGWERSRCDCVRVAVTEGPWGAAEHHGHGAV